MNIRLSYAFCLLLLGTLACGLQSTADTKPDLAATITAQALAMQSRVGTPAPSGTASVAGSDLRVTSTTECRDGPGPEFDLAFTANPGQTFQLIGKNSSTEHWIIDDPAGGSCWLGGSSVVISGDTGALPEYPAPPPPAPAVAEFTRTPKSTKTPEPTPTATLTLIPTPAGPNFPSNLTGTKTCTKITLNGIPYWVEDITLSWQDNAYNESGYYVYRGNPPAVIATLDANVTRFYYQFSYSEYSVQFEGYDQFFVRAFNAVGESLQPGTVIDRCP
jgi:hypothetical protein